MPSDETQQHLRDILAEIARIDEFIERMTFESYQDDVRTTYAVERSLQIVTEAGFRLGEDAERLCPEPDWRNLRGLGNFLRHSYDKVSDRIIWDAVALDLPGLKASVTTALNKLMEQS